MKALVYAPAQLWSDATGNVNGSTRHTQSASIAGFYIGDTRIISDITLIINGEIPVPVACRTYEKGRSLISGIVRNIEGATVDPVVCYEERRSLSAEALRDEVVPERIYLRKKYIRQKLFFSCFAKLAARKKEKQGCIP